MRVSSNFSTAKCAGSESGMRCVKRTSVRHDKARQPSPWRRIQSTSQPQIGRSRTKTHSQTCCFKPWLDTGIRLFPGAQQCQSSKFVCQWTANEMRRRDELMNSGTHRELDWDIRREAHEIWWEIDAVRPARRGEPTCSARPCRTACREFRLMTGSGGEKKSKSPKDNKRGGANARDLGQALQ